MCSAEALLGGYNSGRQVIPSDHRTINRVIHQNSHTIANAMLHTLHADSIHLVIEAIQPSFFP